MRVTERFLADDPPSAVQLEAARSMVDAQLGRIDAQRPPFGEARVAVGLAGTVAAAAAIDQGLERYDRAAVHHYRLTASRVRSLLDQLAGEDVAARRRRPGMEAPRADVIVGGLIVLDAVLTRFALAACLASEADILDGLVATLLAP